MLKHHPRSSLGMAPKLLVAQLSSNKHYILDYKPTMSVGQTIGKKQTKNKKQKKQQVTCTMLHAPTWTVVLYTNRTCMPHK